MKKTIVIFMFLFLLACISESEKLYQRGLDFQEAGRHEEAIFYFDKAIDLKSNHYNAWKAKGHSYADLELYESSNAII